MQRSIPFLHAAARVLAIVAVLAGLAVGLLMNAATFIICFDVCPSPDAYFSQSGMDPLSLLTPCVAFAAFALFFGYCLATRQRRRALIVFLVLVVGGLVGMTALGALTQHARATLPVTEGGLLVEGPLTAWAHQFAFAYTVALVVWTGTLAGLEWGRHWNTARQRAGA
jgi:hypothetical protein